MGVGGQASTRVRTIPADGSVDGASLLFVSISQLGAFGGGALRDGPAAGRDLASAAGLNGDRPTHAVHATPRVRDPSAHGFDAVYNL